MSHKFFIIQCERLHVDHAKFLITKEDPTVSFLSHNINPEVIAVTSKLLAQRTLEAIEGVLYTKEVTEIELRAMFSQFLPDLYNYNSRRYL